ncbi:MAG TPA: lipocalin-like domain-containing protein [Bdellovibrionota bacterium]|nr:lipocalin-like domain-containing protein [Bdellovibrionota bacterium]
MTKNQLVGVWKLVSYRLLQKGQKSKQPFGPSPVGYLTYTRSGWMSAVLTATKRKRFRSGKYMDGTVREKAHAFETFVAYCGPYSVHHGRVIHHVRGSWFENWVGSRQVRAAILRRNLLTLSTPPYTVNGHHEFAQLVWKKTEESAKLTIPE